MSLLPHSDWDSTHCIFSSYTIRAVTILRKAADVKRGLGRTTFFSSPASAQMSSLGDTPNATHAMDSLSAQRGFNFESDVKQVWNAIKKFKSSLPVDLNSIIRTSKGDASVDPKTASLVGHLTTYYVFQVSLLTSSCLHTQQFIIAYAELTLSDDEKERPNPDTLSHARRIVGIIRLLRDEVSESSAQLDGD